MTPVVTTGLLQRPTGPLSCGPHERNTHTAWSAEAGQAEPHNWFSRGSLRNSRQSIRQDVGRPVSLLPAPTALGPLSFSLSRLLVLFIFFYSFYLASSSLPSCFPYFPFHSPEILSSLLPAPSPLYIRASLRGATCDFSFLDTHPRISDLLAAADAADPLLAPSRAPEVLETTKTRFSRRALLQLLKIHAPH